MKGEKQGNIVLGRGVFKIDGTLMGLTRDGGTFAVEYTHNAIVADGDRGKVKGRILRDEAIPKLTINHLELLTEIEKLHPAIKADTSSESGYTVLSGTGKLTETDYHTVTFEGETKDGREVVITVNNAINLENINWELKDKDQIIDTVTFEGTYDPEAEDAFDENWEVKYKTA